MSDTQTLKRKAAARPNGARRRRGRPRLEQVADIENELVEVALVEFLKYGYGDTSMAMIVKAAGVSKTTLYSRFSSKQELFIAMMQKMVAGDLSAQIRAVHAPDRSLGEMLREFAVRSLEIGLDPVHYGVIRLVYGESHRFPELREAGEKLSGTMMNGLLNIIKGYAEREGITFRNPEIPARTMTMALRGLHLDVLLSENKKLDDERRREIDQLVALVMASVDDW